MVRGLPDFTRQISVNVDITTGQIFKLATHMATSQVSVGVAETALLAANPARIAVLLLYTGTQNVYWGESVPLLTSGVKMAQNVTIIVSGYTGALNAIADVAAQTVFVGEFT